MSAVLEKEQEILNQKGIGAEGEPKKQQLLLGTGSLVLAAIEAVCIFFVSANGLIVLLGGVSISVAQGVLFFHSAPIRLPLLALATLGALLNLWLLFNSSRLRNAASAKWRKKPQLPKERRRIILVAALSVGTLILVGTELYIHHREHGSAFASIQILPRLLVSLSARFHQ